MKHFGGKTAVVTGAASGIGRALAGRLAEAGARLVLADADGEGLEETRARIGTDSVAVVTDVADPQAVETLAAESFARGNAVHLLFNNAGVVGRFAPIWQQEPGEWQRVLAVNVVGVANVLRAFVPRMTAQGAHGHIVNTASEAGFAARAYVGVYHASKHAVLAISETLAQELSLEGADLRVSVLCPGGVNTSIMDSRPDRPAAVSGRAAALEGSYRQALGGAMAPEAVADVVLDGIREQRFYLFPDPAVAGLAAARANAVANDTYPAVNPALAERLGDG